MKNESIWLENMEIEKRESLKENIEIDILIIGGGITGITSAYFLKDTNLKIALVERNQLLNGVTSKTTGKINYLQGIIYSKIKKMYDENIASMYLKSQKEAIEIIRNIIQKENIDCNLEQVESRVETKDKKEELKKEYQFLKENNINIEEYEENKTYGIKVEDTFVFHPIKYLNGIVNKKLEGKINIYEQTNIINIKKEKDHFLATTQSDYKIKAKKIILACHYPFFLFPYFLPIKTYIEKSYIRANKITKDGQFTKITTYPNILSERFLKDKKEIFKITLINSHKISSKWNEEKNFKPLKKVNQDFIWSNEDIMTYDSLPFIGEIKENLYLATGFNTWGMTNGTLSGKIISELILKIDNEYTKLFNPYRKNLKTKLIQYPINIFSNTKSFIGNKLKIRKHWYPENLEIKKENGKQIAIYKDKNGIHKVYTTCPHMGCTLLFNEVEKTWDCPCHASKFDIDGNCLKGPSKYNIRVK